MKKTQIVNLLRKVFVFKNDNCEILDGYTFYRWRSRELCQVLGVMELEPGEVTVCVGVGEDLFDFQHIALEEFEQVIDTSRDFSTELATADRPQGTVVRFKV